MWRFDCQFLGRKGGCNRGEKTTVPCQRNAKTSSSHSAPVCSQIMKNCPMLFAHPPVRPVPEGGLPRGTAPRTGRPRATNFTSPGFGPQRDVPCCAVSLHLDLSCYSLCGYHLASPHRRLLLVCLLACDCLLRTSAASPLPFSSLFLDRGLELRLRWLCGLSEERKVLASLLALWRFAATGHLRIGSKEYRFLDRGQRARDKPVSSRTATLRLPRHHGQHRRKTRDSQVQLPGPHDHKPHRSPEQSNRSPVRPSSQPPISLLPSRNN